MQNFSAAQLHTYLQQHSPMLLDVREPWEFKLCHIDNSQLIPMGSLPSRLHELNPDQETVLICHHGIRSRQVGLYLEHQGFTQLINLQGGVDAWARDVDRTMAVY